MIHDRTTYIYPLKTWNIIVRFWQVFENLQDSRICGNGKWIFGKILREIARKFSKIMSKLCQNWPQIGKKKYFFEWLLQLNILSTDNLNGTNFKELVYIFSAFLLLQNSILVTFYKLFPAGNRLFFSHSCGKWKTREFSRSNGKLSLDFLINLLLYFSRILWSFGMTFLSNIEPGSMATICLLDVKSYLYSLRTLEYFPNVIQ